MAKKNETNRNADEKREPLKLAKGEERWEPVPVKMDALDWQEDEAEWYIPGHNEKGQSTRVTVRIAPEMERAMDIDVQSRKFPYKTQGDLIRHAIYRHLYRLHRAEPSLERHMLAALEMMKTVLQDDQMRNGITEMLDSFKHRLEFYRQEGNLSEAQKIANICAACLEVVKDGAHKNRTKKAMMVIMRPYLQAHRELQALGRTSTPALTPTDFSALPEPVVENDDEDYDADE